MTMSGRIIVLCQGQIELAGAHIGIIEHAPAGG